MNNSDDYRRKSDDMLIELTTRFNTFMENYKASEAERIEWRKNFEIKMLNIEDRMKTMLIPYRISIWAFTIIGGGLIVKSIERVIQLIQDHIHFR